MEKESLKKNKKIFKKDVACICYMTKRIMFYDGTEINFTENDSIYELIKSFKTKENG